MRPDLQVVLGLAVLLGGLLTGCSDSVDEDQPSTAVSDSTGVSIATSIVSDAAPTCAATESVRIGSLDGESGIPLYGVNGASLLDDGRLAVLNRGTSEVLVISPSGDLLSRFGREGDGPSEFKNLWSVHVRPPDTLVVGDYRPWRFTFFTPDGDFIRRVELQPPEMERPDYAMPLVSGSGFMMEQPHYEVADEWRDRIVPLQLYGEDGQSTGTLGDFWLDRFGYLAREIRYVGNPIFGAKARFAALPSGEILYAPARHEQLEVWDRDGTLKRIIRWTARPRDVEPGAGDAWRRAERAAIEARFEITPELEPVIDAQTGPHLPVAEVYPANDQVVIGRDGAGWVEEYRRPSDEGLTRWFRFELSGEFRCVADLDPDLRLLAASEDRLYGLVRDDLDVEYIVVYALGEPQASPVS